MKIIQVTTKEFEKIPGYTTKIPSVSWRGKIGDLLDELDEMETVSVERRAWYQDKGVKMGTLLVEMKLQVGNVERTMGFQFEPVLIRREVRSGGRHGRKKLVDEERASWKLFHDLMRLKFTAARLGAVEIHHEFMSYISKQLPDGSTGTFADFMDAVIESQEGLEGLQLEFKPKRKEVDSVIEI